jgi:hypothetical protein
MGMNEASWEECISSALNELTAARDRAPRLAVAEIEDLQNGMIRLLKAADWFDAHSGS